MRRGTSLPMKIIVSNLPTTEIQTIWVTIEQEGISLTKSNPEVTIEGTVVTVPLTQKETLRFKKGVADAQIRILCTDGTADASNIMKIFVDDVLKEGEIT